MEIRRMPDGRYRIEDALIKDLSDVQGAVRALKKPIPITACKINEPFTVDTTEGTMTGRTGDWLMQGVSGEMYICPADIFEKSYDILASASASGEPDN